MRAFQIFIVLLIIIAGIVAIASGIIHNDLVAMFMGGICIGSAMALVLGEIVT